MNVSFRAKSRNLLRRIMRKLIFVLALTLSACKTTQPCDPGDALVNATLWVQSQAEYRAAALQTYAAAQRVLDLELVKRADKPPAIILDLDETALDNSAFAAQQLRKGMTFTFGDDWSAWVAQSAAAAVPGAKEFLAYAQSRGVTPFYITNRTHAMQAATRTNLEKLGFPVGDDTILTRGDSTDKSARRDSVASRYRVILLLGDDLNDFAPRATALAADPSMWGSKWFLISNPIYGSWESAATGGSGTPCEQLQKKIDFLRP